MALLSQFGLVFSVVGSLLVAFSVIKNPGESYDEIGGKKVYYASILLEKFKWGIRLIVLGFIVQLIPQLIDVSPLKQEDAELDYNRINQIIETNAQVASSSIGVDFLIKAHNADRRAFEFLDDIYRYEIGERSLLQTFFNYEETFCPHILEKNNIFQSSKSELSAIRKKYDVYYKSNPVYGVLDIKEATLDTIEYNCKSD